MRDRRELNVGYSGFQLLIDASETLGWDQCSYSCGYSAVAVHSVGGAC